MFFNCRNRAFNACRHLGGGGALYSHLNDASHASTPHSQGGPQAAQNSANNGANLTPQEQLLNGTWECNPETDPIIYTTDYGLDIRWSMAGLPTNSANIQKIPASEYLNGYAYFEHADKKWAIIGYSNKSATLNGHVNVNNILTDDLLISCYISYRNYPSYYAKSGNIPLLQWYFGESSTPAKNAILNDYSSIGNDVIYNMYSQAIKSALFPNAVASDELEPNEVLCFCQTTIGKSTFNTTTYQGNRYYGSVLKSTIDTFYNNNMTDLPIVGKALTTKYKGGTGIDSTNITASNPAYMFPLAGRDTDETFYYDTYLNAGSGENININAEWWLRSGSSTAHYANCIYYDVYATNASVDFNFCVRPAFVLKI